MKSVKKISMMLSVVILSGVVGSFPAQSQANSSHYYCAQSAPYKGTTLQPTYITSVYLNSSDTSLENGTIAISTKNPGQATRFYSSKGYANVNTAHGQALLQQIIQAYVTQTKVGIVVKDGSHTASACAGSDAGGWSYGLSGLAPTAD